MTPEEIIADCPTGPDLLADSILAEHFLHRPVASLDADMAEADLSQRWVGRETTLHKCEVAEEALGQLVASLFAEHTAAVDTS